MNSIRTAAGRSMAAGIARPLLATIAFAGLIDAAITSANADNLTAEQRALVDKYNISEADQKVLFGTAPAPASAAGSQSQSQAQTAPYRHQSSSDHSVGPKILAGTHVWVGADTYKSIGERITNINGGTGALTGSFGGVAGFNSGFTFGDSDFGVQGGASVGVYDFKGRLRIVPDATDPEWQVFYTAGFYKHSNMSGNPSIFDRISVGAVYDIFDARHWGVNANDIRLSQFRGTLGVALDQSTEVGVWGTVSNDSDRAAVTVAGAPGVLRTIRAMNSLNGYVKHNFDFGGDITIYYGEFDGADIAEWQGGLVGRVPLSHNWSTIASANYVAPNSPAGPNGSGEEQFSASLGVAFYFGGNAPEETVSGNREHPLLDVASNRTFLVTD